MRNQGHALQRVAKKRRDAEAKLSPEALEADPSHAEQSAAADAETDTRTISAQVAGFSTAVAAVQYLILFQGGGRIVLSNGEEFGVLIESCTPFYCMHP